MKRNITFWQIIGFSFVSLFGSLLHFLYDWTSQNPLVALFSAVNESTWEHMKLLFFSSLIFAVFQSFFFKEYKNFWHIKLIGILTGLVAIPILFYTYNGAFGKSPDWINILIFFISAGMSFLLETYLFKRGAFFFKAPLVPIIILSVICFLFFIFTFLPPKIPLFECPVTKTFGRIKG